VDLTTVELDGSSTVGDVLRAVEGGLAALDRVDGGVPP